MNSEIKNFTCNRCEIKKPTWNACKIGNIPDDKVLCRNIYGDVIIGFIYKSDKSKQTGFSAENSAYHMYDCCEWMDIPE